MILYCLKCKKKVDIENSTIEEIKMKNGRDAVTAKCPVCGTKVFQIGKKK